jgi:hypothetical protein
LDKQTEYFLLQAMPQITDRAKLPNIIDPIIRNTMDLRHLYQVINTILISFPGP